MSLTVLKINYDMTLHYLINVFQGNDQKLYLNANNIIFIQQPIHNAQRFIIVTLNQVLNKK